MAARYAIADEPRPSGLGNWVVNPIWPLLAVMAGGAWIGLAWMVLNGAAMGSATLRRECLAAVGCLLGSAVLVLLIAWANEHQGLQGTALRFSLLAVVAIKLASAYAIVLMQSRSFELWEYFGGVSKNGIGVVIVLALFRGKLDALVHTVPLLGVILG